MADLLRSGYTMLNLACPECNNPLFRNKNNETFCSICNKKILFKKNINGQSSSARISENLNDNKNSFDISSLQQIIEEKITYISNILKDETQINLIERYVKILSQLFKLLKKLRNNNASAGI
jgi:uncharacterized Zn finger protein (UPF0148 family)